MNKVILVVSKLDKSFVYQVYSLELYVCNFVSELLTCILLTLHVACSAYIMPSTWRCFLVVHLDGVVHTGELSA